MNSKQIEEHSPQVRTIGTYVILAAVTLAVQLVVALRITLHIWMAAFRPGAFMFERADAFTIPTFLLLQSTIGAFLLWRLRRSSNFLLHAAKGVLMGLCGFLIAAPIAYILLRFSHKLLPVMPPSFFFELIFFLGHRVPLVGVVLGSFMAATLQWSRMKNESRAK